jgi:hypothetical protein
MSIKELAATWCGWRDVRLKDARRVQCGKLLKGCRGERANGFLSV